MFKASISELAKPGSILFKAYEDKRTVFLHGKPGIGKSTVIKAIADHYGVPLNASVRLSSIEPSDLGGIPYVDHESGVMRKYYPDWLPTEGEGILFLDELNKGDPSVQAAAYQLILDRQLGERKLSDDIWIVAAGNRAEDNVTIYDMDSALKNRFALHIEVEQPSEDELLDYFKSKDKHNTFVAGFLKFKPSRVWHYDRQSTDPSWPSPRTWEMFIDMIGKTQDKAHIRNIGIACLGDVTGRELYGYISLTEEVDIQSIIDNPKKFTDIDRPDIRHSVITEVASRYAKTKSLEPKMIDFVFQAVADKPEYLMLALKQFMGVNSNFVAKVLADKRGEKLAKYLNQFL